MKKQKGHGNIIKRQRPANLKTQANKGKDGAKL
jgi:hypothetical protein